MYTNTTTIEEIEKKLNETDKYAEVIDLLNNNIVYSFTSIKTNKSGDK